MRHRNRLAAAVAGMLAAVAGLGACATLPPGGPVQVNGLQGGNGPDQQGVQFVPVGPGAGWSAAQIVEGFLIASASFANDHAVARQYLAPQYRSAWKPGWAATVVDAAPAYARGQQVLPHVNVGSDNTEAVDVTSHYVATLQTAGRYQAGQYGVLPGPQVFSFGLTQTADGWRIDQLPARVPLLLLQPDFVRDYQPRNLYYFAANSGGVLVPDPVFIPQQAGTEGGATGLVESLLRQPRKPDPPAGWLYGAATTAFPRGTSLINVQVTGSEAIVDLGGSAAKAGPRLLTQMAAQLVWSLTGSSYGTPTAIRSVVLEVNHRVWHPVGGQPLGLLKNYSGWVPAMPTAPVYLQDAAGPAAPVIRVLAADGTGSGPVSLPKGFGRGAFSAIAISPGPAAWAVFAGCRGKNVYASPLLYANSVSTQALPARCTSLSWDNQGNLWAATGGGVFMVLPNGPVGGLGQVVTVVDPGLPSSDTVTSLRVAPDGVRAAMIVATNAGVKVMVAAISRHRGANYLAQSTQMATVGSDIAGIPKALSWWDADHLLVLDQPAGEAAQLYEVPLNGGVSTPVVTPAAAVSVATSGSAVLVGTAPVHNFPLGQIWRSSGLNGPWRLVTAGDLPVAPG